MTDLRTRMADVADNLDHYAGKTDGGTYAGGLSDAAGQIRAALGGVQVGGAEEALRDALLKHHPIAHTMTGPLSGCRCGQVGLGQDVIAHVTDHLRAALAATDPS